MNKKLNSVVYNLQMPDPPVVCNPSHATQDSREGGINLAGNIDNYQLILPLFIKFSRPFIQIHKTLKYGIHKIKTDVEKCQGFPGPLQRVITLPGIIRSLQTPGSYVITFLHFLHQIAYSLTSPL
jgi:hypothetical protein